MSERAGLDGSGTATASGHGDERSAQETEVSGNPAGNEPDQQPGFITVRTVVGFLAWLLYLCHTTVDLDGRSHRSRWGVHRFRVAPGRHPLGVSFSYLFRSTTGVSDTLVEVSPGESLYIRYRTPFLMFRPGKLTVTHTTNATAPHELVPLANAGAALSRPGWYADPVSSTLSGGGTVSSGRPIRSTNALGLASGWRSSSRV